MNSNEGLINVSYLIELMSECAEIIHIASKCIEFGFDNFHPDDPEHITNVKLLEKEIGDCIAVVFDIADLKIGISDGGIALAIRNKTAKLDFYRKFKIPLIQGKRLENI